MQHRIEFYGEIISVQPRSNVWRYQLDNRNHALTGYNIFLKGVAEGEEKHFSIAISEKVQEKYRFHIGDCISGTGWTKKYPKLEYADYYRIGSLKKIKEVPYTDNESGPPWTSEVPPASVYDWRGCRILEVRRWRGKCFQCKWAAMANVAIEYDWGVKQQFKFESFCYGPKNCKYYNMGHPRSVPNKRTGTLYDDGCLDEILTENRGDED